MDKGIRLVERETERERERESRKRDVGTWTVWDGLTGVAQPLDTTGFGNFKSTSKACGRSLNSLQLESPVWSRASARGGSIQ